MREEDSTHPRARSIPKSESASLKSGEAGPTSQCVVAGFYKSIRSCLRNDHWYQKLVWSYREWHLVTRITFGKLRPTSHWCFLCPDKSMAPVLAITDMVARARRDDSLL